ncbi:hypothetical protein Gotur_034697 [Gossypium turneri]
MLPMSGCSRVGLSERALFRPIIRVANGSIRYIKPPLFPSSYIHVCKS